MSSKIYSQMSKVMAEIGHVGKDQKNSQQGFKFRGIDQFVNALYPALIKHGVFMAPRCTSESHELKNVVRSSGKEGVDKHVTIMMEYDFFADDGSKVTIGPVPAEGLDSGDKATNKALSAALKYALIQTFSIPTEDMTDGDSDSPEISKSKTTNPEKEEVKQSAKDLKAVETLKNEIKVEAKQEVKAEQTVAKKSGWSKPKAQTTTKSSEDLF